MRVEGPIDWMVQALVIGPDEAVAIHLPDGMSEQDAERVVEVVEKTWSNVPVVFFGDGIRITSIELDQWSI